MNKHIESAIFTAPTIFTSYIVDPYVKEKIYTMDEIDDLLEFANKNQIYHFGTGNCNTDQKRFKEVISYGEKKYGGYSIEKSDLVNFDGVKDGIMSFVYPELHFILFPFMRLFSSTGQRAAGGGYGIGFKSYYSFMQHAVKRKIGNPEPRVYKFDYGK